MSDQQRVVYPYGTSGHGYRIAYKTFVYYRLIMFGGGALGIGLLLGTSAFRDNTLFFAGMAFLLLTFGVLVAIARFGRLSSDRITWSIAGLPPAASFFHSIVWLLRPQWSCWLRSFPFQSWER